jgi:hypothetical protein
MTKMSKRKKLIITMPDEQQWKKLVKQAWEQISIREEIDERETRGWFRSAGISNAIETNRRRH